MLRVGIIGVGNMGSNHAQCFKDNKVENGKLTAICDINPDKLDKQREKFGDEVAYFENASDLINSGLVDGVIIATPHYFHPEMSIEAFNAGLHVLCEKPIGVYTKNIHAVNEAAKKSGKAFQVNFILRSYHVYKKIKEMMDNKEIGEMKRVTWIITDWYRNQAYFNSGGWRATWGGEGGGTLLNQNPHQLDLFQWFCGMPKRVRAFCYFGKNRDVEIEDEATAYFEYENGATGTYITTVSEFPGTNRLEIVGTKGKIVYENGKIKFTKLAMDERDFNKTCEKPFGEEIEKEEIDVEFDTSEQFNLGIMINNWVNAAVNGEELIAPGYEGINSLNISNAIYLSTWNDDWVEFPVDEDAFYDKLQEKIKNSTFVKQEVKEVESDFSSSFHKA